MDHALRLLHGYRQRRASYYQWRAEASVTAKFTMAVGIAALTGLLAQVKMYLPWTPIPIVASQFGVILAAVLLGKRWGGASMAIYALGGLVGIPWFAGLNGGVAALAGPTGGYILGYILAALFMGSLFDGQPTSRALLPQMATILFAQLVVVYVPGLIHLALWLKLTSGQSLQLLPLLWMGYLPFVAGDVLKSIVGGGLASILVNRE